jgi:hypothetical protein
MSLEGKIKQELLTLRKLKTGTTPEVLIHAEALCTILGDGDPRVTYNLLKHLVLGRSDQRSIMAAAYSLGFASNGATHLDRLTAFGYDHGFDQRQARRYSDRGITELARSIASEYTIETSPVLRGQILRWDDRAIEVLVTTERLPFIEMRVPLVEVIQKDGERMTLECVWQEKDDNVVRGMTHVAMNRTDQHSALSVCWRGEIWPCFVCEFPCPDESVVGLSVQTLGNRMQISCSGG